MHFFCVILIVNGVRVRIEALNKINTHALVHNDPVELRTVMYEFSECMC